jgi:nicotinamidase-related amidase
MAENKTVGRAALVVVDVQEGFTDPRWGPTTNYPGCETNIERLLQVWAEHHLPLVTVRHDSIKPESPLNPARPGNALIGPVAGAAADLLVTKTVNTAFYGTPDLERWLRSEGLGQIVVCGIQTNMCVETTARMGGNLGFDVVVPLDATRTFDLAAPDGTVVPAATLMQVTAANLQGGGFARVVSTADLISELDAKS